MDAGTCPACARPYTPGELQGLGILRARPADGGGPLLEFECPRCGRRMLLVPHGEGRYARPGEPPPAQAVPPEERIPPWMQGGGTKRAAPDPEPQSPPVRGRDPQSEPEPIETPAPPPPPEGEQDAPLTLPEALDVLGIGPTAPRKEIDRAFRERSRTCHPDKVAHLDADFQELADRKFRRLLSAYELLTS